MFRRSLDSVQKNFLDFSEIVLTMFGIMILYKCRDDFRLDNHSQSGKVHTMASLAKYVRYFGIDAVNADRKVVAEAVSLRPNGKRFPIPHGLATSSEIEQNKPVSLATLNRRIRQRRKIRQDAEDKQFSEMLRVENLDNYVQFPDDLDTISPANADERMQYACQIGFVQKILAGTANGEYDNE